MTPIFISLLVFLGVFAEAREEVRPIKERHLAERCSRLRKGEEISRIMLHFCSIAPEEPKNPYDLDKILALFEANGVSAHYIIHRDGQIYELVNEKRVAYHAGKGKLPFSPAFENNLNSHSIGIEMTAIGSEKDMLMFMSKESYAKIDKKLLGFTESQYKSLNWLLKDIMSRNPAVKNIKEHVIGHSDYAPTRRTDPGELFDWKKIGL